MNRGEFLALFFLQFFIYWMGLAPSVTLLDSGELITAAAGAGVPHPPGYPLFTMLGYVFSKIPVGSIAYRLNLMSAFFSALSIALLASACCRLFDVRELKFKLIVALTAILVGSLPHFYRQAVITEVYALNNLLVSLLIWLLVLWHSGRRKRSTCYWFFFVFGLSLCNHHTTWVFGLLGILTIYLIDKKQLASLRLWSIGLGLFFLGLTPYFYLYFSSITEPIIDWGNPENGVTLLRLLLGHSTSPKY